MCGLFGVMVPLNYPHPRRLALSTSIRFLGVLAEERGTDAAGIATLDLAATRASAGGWTIHRTSRRFSTLPQTSLTREIRRAHIVMGHTRWATQGSRTVANASPMRVDRVLGTHNGDIDTASLAPFTASAGQRGTDSAVLFAALSEAHEAGSTTDDLAMVLSSSVGRIATVWADVAAPGQLWIARGALSPLAVARDAHGAIWWASNPAWLRRMRQHLGVALGTIAQLDEGTLLVAEVGEFRCELVQIADLVTHVRLSDRATEHERLRHRIVREASQKVQLQHLAQWDPTTGATLTIDGALV